MLTPNKGCDIIIKSRAQATRQAAVAQSVERRIGSAEVTGPIPVSSFGERRFDRISAFFVYCLTCFVLKEREAIDYERIH